MSVKNFNHLTDKDKEYIKMIHDADMNHNEKMEILTKKFSKTSRTIRGWWTKMDLKEDFNKLPPQLKKAKEKIFPDNVDVVFYTSAQNKTSINRRMLSKMLIYKKFIEDMGKKVEIVVSPSRYRNPTSLSENDKTKSEMWWEDEILEYLYYDKIFFEDCLLSANSRIRPTAAMPLMGYEVLAKDKHLILPHPRIHFKTTARFKGKALRTMSTTGYLTTKNYSDSKAGERAWEHHSYGFSIIEKKEEGKVYTPRNVKVSDDGSFYDLIYSISDDGVKVIDDCLGMVLGDVHASHIDKKMHEITLDLLDRVKPKQVVFHDLFDGSTINPHETKDFFIQRRKIIENKYLLEDEINLSFDVLGSFRAENRELCVIISNHDIFLDRYINDGNWKRDLHNSPSYLKYAYLQQTIDLRKYGSLYGYLLLENFNEGDVRYINYGESLDIGGYECGMHGDHGSNGARGSASTFKKANTKIIIAHIHQPTMLDGVTVVGVMCILDQYYTRRGLSSWGFAHSIIHPNSKNQLWVFDMEYDLSGLI